MTVTHVPCRTIPITLGTGEQTLVDMQDLLDLCCGLLPKSCSHCRAQGQRGEVVRRFKLMDANGLLCFVLPKSGDNKLLDVNGRELELNLQKALHVTVGSLDLHLRILHICHGGHHYGYFYHAACHTSQVQAGWYFYDDMQHRGRALFIGSHLKFWHDPSSIECLMYIKK
jgi:hypothetical protein